MSSEILSEAAITGRFYMTWNWGPALCCGTTGGNQIMAFAVRIGKQTKMKYLHEKSLTPLDDWTDWELPDGEAE